MKTKKTGAVSRLLLGSLILIGLMAGLPPAIADDAGVTITEVQPTITTVAPAAAVAPAAVTAPSASPTPSAGPTVVVAPAPMKTGLEALRDQLLAILIPTFVLFVGALATAALSKFKKKLGLDVSEKVAVQWQMLAQSAALRGAEWARKKTKEMTDGKKVPGPEVLDVAVNWATDMAVHQGLPELARAKLEGLIEAELFKLRREEDRTPGDPFVPSTKV
jgi:hypothetical protein